MSGGGSSQPSTTTTISKSEPPEYVKPFSIQQMEKAGSLANTPYRAYTGQRIAGLTQDHTNALDMTRQRAMQGSEAINSASQHAANVFGDQYLNQGVGLAGMQNRYAGENPYLQQMIDNASGDVTKHYNNVVNPQLQAMDRASGAYGNTGIQQARADAQEGLAKQLGDISTNMRGQNYLNSANLEQQRIGNMANMYSNERQAQMGAMEFAPQLAEQDYIDAQNLLGVGDILRNQTQQGLDFNYDQWLQQQQHPYKQLDVLQNAIRTSMGGGGSNIVSAPNPYASNGTANMIGTGLAGYGALQGLLQ